MRPLFRQQALDQLASPEQLDQLMHVVRPRHWLALAALGVLVSAALLWGMFGRLPTTVMGRGVLIHPRKVVDVQAPASGRLATLDVRVGEAIRAGDRFGTIDQAELRRQLQEERVKVQELLVQDRDKRTLQAQQTALQAQQTTLDVRAIELQRRDLLKRLQDAQGKVPVLMQRLENRKRLEALGLVARVSDERLQAEQAVQDNQDKVAALQTELQQLDSKVKQLESAAKRLTLSDLESTTARKNQLQELQSRIALLEVQLATNSQITSQYTGRLLELTVHVGQMLQPGLRLASLEVEDATSTLVGVSYFPIKAGKKIQPGMTIHVALDTVERERFGSLLGRVTTVSTFPVTREGIASLVGNAEVVATLAAQGPVIEVAATLLPDASTISGYQWSSSTGPAARITSGTTTTGRVVLEQRAPMSYLLPILRDASGLY